MPLFRIEGQKVTKVSPTEFQNERELQILIDNNLEDILGVRLVESWFDIPNGQIDALGIDERNAPVVIEYKWKQDTGAITQGLFYLDWVRGNRRAFELLVKDKLGKGIHVDWNSPSRLIVIARDFTPRDVSAIKYMTQTVELMKYSYYGDLINIENLTPAQAAKIIMLESRKLPDGTREWPDGDIVWVREGTYSDIREAKDVEADLKSRGYNVDRDRVPRSYRDDPYWADAKTYVVYRSKEPHTKARSHATG
jgi:hypothetical protein